MSKNVEKSLSNSSKSSEVSQSGSVLVVAVASLAGLLALGGIASVSVQNGTRVVAHEKFQLQALASAVSGVYAAIDYLQQNISDSNDWSALTHSNNLEPGTTELVYPQTAITGNTIKAGETGSLFSEKSRQQFNVRILNNKDDVGFALSPSEGPGWDHVNPVRRIGPKRPPSGH